MYNDAAIMFDFPDERSALNAFSLLQELGYDPVMQDHNTLHIHVVHEDLTSALEIVQFHGGILVEQSQIGNQLIANTAYPNDTIYIPAHLVNEDWIDEDEEY